MLSNISFQLTETLPSSGESLASGGTPPVGAGETGTFADLLRGTPGAFLVRPPGVAGKTLPFDGKPSPIDLPAELPLEGIDLALETASETAAAAFAVPVDPALRPSLPEAPLTGATGGAAPLPAAGDRAAIATNNAATAAGAAPVPNGETGLPILPAAVQPAPTTADRPTVRRHQPAAGELLATSSDLLPTAADADAGRVPADRPQPGPVLEAVLAGLGRDASILPMAEPAGLQASSANASPPAFANALQALSGGAGVAAAPTTPTPPLVSTAIDIPVGEGEWAEAFGDRVLVMSTGNQVQRAEIRLHPAELGPVQVRISVEDDATTLSFTAHHAVTRDAIEQALPRLREIFSDNGLSLGNATVAEHGGRQAERDAAEGTGGALAADMPGIVDADDGEPVSPSRLLRAANQLIDTFA